jgi:hypothetical protein
MFESRFGRITPEVGVKNIVTDNGHEPRWVDHVMADKPRVALRALLFDVQGTATDFNSTVQAEATRISAGRHGDVD